MRQFAALFAVTTPTLFVFWLVFVGTFVKWEMLVGMAVSIVGALAICIVQRADREHFHPRLRDLVQIARVPWLLVQDTWVILWSATRDLLGGRKSVSAFRVAQFEAGSLDDPRDTARRVLAVGYNTMTPNCIIFGINTREKHMLFHQVERQPIPKLMKVLGARE